MWKLKKKKKLILPFRVKNGLVQAINNIDKETEFTEGTMTTIDVIDLIEHLKRSNIKLL
jgi:hypothetical protein